jgi:protein SCO1
MRAAIVLALLILTPLMLRLYGTSHQAWPERPLPTIARAPEFTLTSQDRVQVALGDLRAKVVAVTFFYTLCTDTCPVLTPTMSFIQDQLGADFGTKIAFISITVDPERDTPEVLKEYAQAFGANLAGWSFLTGRRCC